MTNYQRTANWLHACGKKPGNTNQLSVQIGCHLEEVLEFLDALNITEVTRDGIDPSWNLAREWNEMQKTLEAIADLLKTGHARAKIDDESRVQVLDALCDCEVTGNGIAYLAGFDKDEADRRVLASNESKLFYGQPVFLPGGKIGKGPDYKPPVLEDCV